MGGQLPGWLRYRDYCVVLYPLYRVFLVFLKQTTHSGCHPVYRPWVGDLDGTRSGPGYTGPGSSPSDPRVLQERASHGEVAPAATHVPQGISGRIFNDLYLFRWSKICTIEHLENTGKLEEAEVTTHPLQLVGFPLVSGEVWSRRSLTTGQLPGASFLITSDAFPLLKMRL